MDASYLFNSLNWRAVLLLFFIYVHHFLLLCTLINVSVDSHVKWANMLIMPLLVGICWTFVAGGINLLSMVLILVSSNALKTCLIATVFYYHSAVSVYQDSGICSYLY